MSHGGNESTSTTAPPSTRLRSVDALRGFDMFWIVGAAAIVKALDKTSDNAATSFLTTQLTHVKWEGFRFYDLIFPLFLFIVGISIVFSLDKAFDAGGRASVLRRVFRRGAVLYALGVFYHGGLSRPWPDVQLGGVLHRIAACYVLAALIYAFVRKPTGLGISAAILLVGYWALRLYCLSCCWPASSTGERSSFEFECCKGSLKCSFTPRSASRHANNLRNGLESDDRLR